MKLNCPCLVQSGTTTCEKALPLIQVFYLWPTFQCFMLHHVYQSTSPSSLLCSCQVSFLSACSGSCHLECMSLWKTLSARSSWERGQCVLVCLLNGFVVIHYSTHCIVLHLVKPSSHFKQHGVIGVWIRRLLIASRDAVIWLYFYLRSGCLMIQSSDPPPVLSFSLMSAYITFWNWGFGHFNVKKS